jgi:hypothetical protein
MPASAIIGIPFLLAISNQNMIVEHHNKVFYILCNIVDVNCHCLFKFILAPFPVCGKYQNQML